MGKKKDRKDVASCPERLCPHIKYSNIYLFRGINLSNVASEAPKISPDGIQISPGLRYFLGFEDDEFIGIFEIGRAVLNDVVPNAKI